MNKIVTSQDKIKEIEILEAGKKIVDAEYDIVKEERFAEIQIIEEKYSKSMSEFSTKVSDYNQKISDAKTELINLIHNEEWMEALGSGVINEFYINVLIKKCKIGSSNIDIKQKKVLSNNIDVWMVTKDGYSASKFYLAFYEGKLVGTSYRETGKHAGDSTTPFSFIGQFEEPFRIKKYLNRFHGDTYSDFVNATFTDWMNELKTIDLEEATLIPMNENTLNEIKLGVNNYWSEYSWEEKMKNK